MTLSAPPAAFDPANIHDTVERLLHDFLEQQKRAAPDLPEIALLTSLLRGMITTLTQRDV